MAAPLYTDCDSQSHMYAHVSHAHAACTADANRYAIASRRVADRGSTIAVQLFTFLQDYVLIVHS